LSFGGRCFREIFFFFSVSGLTGAVLVSAVPLFGFFSSTAFLFYRTALVLACDLFASYKKDNDYCSAFSYCFLSPICPFLHQSHLPRFSL